MTEAHQFDPVIIREYDIRGIVGKNLNPADASALGRAFGTTVRRAGGESVVVGYDGRTHSPGFEASLVEGLLACGLRVERIGLGPTPMLYFAVIHRKVDAGIMVTGSHNPGDQNGFKMLLARHLKDGGPVYGEKIKKLAALAAAADYVDGEGKAESVDVRDAYVARLLEVYRGTKPLKTVWDNGNGAAGEIVQRLTAKLPGEHILLYPEIDGRFPNHHPDPSVPENMKDLQAAVKEHGADLGVALDGDADRIGAVDGAGRILAGDQLLAIYAAEVLKEQPGATIIADVKASQVLFDHIAAHGGVPLMWKTGNTLIKAKMVETNAPLAGEMSGHIFFGDNNNHDDGIYAAVRLLSLVSSSGKSLASWRDTLPTMVTTPEMLLKVDESRKFAIVDEIKARLLQAGENVNTTDGVRVATPDGWWLLRASNTQAALGARAEARDQAGLARLMALLAGQLKASGVEPPASR
ncbi:MAG: phosphomannomutase/phosphoglucomutase [Alphaproteobacteria bacterium]|nr:phosphomannomutase/phosphoglucomutase [Alphaproteobacteria bacterium]